MKLLFGFIDAREASLSVGVFNLTDKIKLVVASRAKMYVYTAIMPLFTAVFPQELSNVLDVHLVREVRIVQEQKGSRERARFILMAKNSDHNRNIL